MHINGGGRKSGKGEIDPPISTPPLPSIGRLYTATPSGDTGHIMYTVQPSCMRHEKVEEKRKTS